MSIGAKDDHNFLPANIGSIGEEATVGGIVKVHESVILSIVRKTACEVPGVIRMAGNSFVDNLADIVGNRRIFDKAVRLEMGDNTVSLEVQLILEYGCNIPEVAREVQKKIAEEILNITGMTVNKVNIVVADLDEEDEEEDEEEESSSPDTEKD